MRTLEGTSLSSEERTLLEHFVQRAREELGEGLHGIWLFGSRARGEPPAHEDSDVDVLVLVDDDSWDGGKAQVYRVLRDAAEELGQGGLTIWFSLKVHTPEWLEERRAIKSFFMAEIDRDKIELELGP